MKEQFIEMVFSMRWLWFIMLIMSWVVVNRIIRLEYDKLTLRREEIIKTFEYDEEKIIKHLDYIVTEEIDRYIILTLTPKNIYYINNNEQEKITKHLVEVIPDRLSPYLLEQLALIYDRDYIGEFLGQYIYAKVLDLVLKFNTKNLDERPDILALYTQDKKS